MNNDICKTHPKYQGVRKPKSCAKCFAIFHARENSKTLHDLVNVSNALVFAELKQEREGTTC
jgi:hypothetical protein